MVFSFAGFCTGVSAAIVVKLTSSIDDVLWLSAFFTPKLSNTQRTQNALTYVCICLLQTCLAFFISTYGQEVMASLLGNKQDGMSTDRISTLISGSALFVYSTVLAKEYYHENYGGENDEEYSPVDNTIDVAGSSSVKYGYEQGESKEDGTDFKPNPQDVELGSGVLPLEIEDGTDSNLNDSLNDISRDTDMKEEVKDESFQSDKESQSLAVIAFVGSLDDLTLFVPMLVGKTFGIVELILGAMTSAIAIVFLCLFLTKCKLVADTLEKIPLVVIVMAFCVVLLFKAICFMD